MIALNALDPVNLTSADIQASIVCAGAGPDTLYPYHIHALHVNLPVRIYADGEGIIPTAGGGRDASRAWSECPGALGTT